MNDKIRITSIDGLRSWNNNPTEEKPILLEWFLNFFFTLLDEDKFKEAVEAHELFLIFTIKCEKLTPAEAEERIRSSLDYYAGYASSRWPDKLNDLRERIGK